MTTVLADRYELEEPLGAGGMASVYRGTDRVLDRTVAVKVLDRSLGRDPEFVERFRREARAAAGLTHPGTVAVYDTGEDGGRRFIVMELIDGETLADMLAREAPLDPKRAALLATEILEALAAAHDRGLVHRDVKPGNVLLTSEGEPKVADFGIARAATSETITVGSKVLGTAAYLSPEQARGRPVDARCDLYAVGCVLYEMLTGAPPFRGGSPVSVATKHIHEDPPPLPSSIPPALATVVMRALEKEPDDRFPDARSMAAAVRGGTGGAGTASGGTDVLDRADLETEAVPAPPAAPTRRWLLPALLGALLLAALIGGLVLAFDRDDPTAGSSGGRDRGGAAAEPSPAESPQEAAEPLRPQEAFAALLGTVQDAFAAGEIEEKLARDIVKRAEDAMEAYGEGDLQKALDKAGDAINALVAGAEQGEVTPERASEIEQRIRGLQAAFEAYPPREPEEDEDEDGSDDRGPDGEGPPGPDDEGPPGQDDDT